MTSTALQQAPPHQNIMLAFAASTGLSDTSREPRRYLWTDAFAVCNYLELYRQTGKQTYLQLALALVDQVHQVLGQHRKDSAYNGWLCGLEAEEARQHPTLGGLRIGKELNERLPGETADESREWNQDGQYFHYLTKWMHALVCVTRDTENYVYTQWAVELAKAAHAAFVYTTVPGGSRRMYWKMSIDLSRPLVDSMGQHDPLDGLITYLTLQAMAKRAPEQYSMPTLDTEIQDMSAMCAGQRWATADALGIGGLATDTYRLVQLIEQHHLDESARLEDLLHDLEYSLHALVANNLLSFPVTHRLAFRELGLAIGLHALSRSEERMTQHPGHFKNARQLTSALAQLAEFQPLSNRIENFWLAPAHQCAKTWREHADINNVMLATSLAPGGYLQL